MQRSAKIRVFRWIPLSFGVQWWSHPRLTLNRRTLSSEVRYRTSYWTNAKRDVLTRYSVSWTICKKFCNFNSNRYIIDILEPYVVIFFQLISRVEFQHYNARPHIASNYQAFFSAHQIQLLTWYAYLHDMSHIEYVWNFVIRRLASDAC